MQKERRFTILNIFDLTINNFWAFCKAWKVWLSYSFALAFFSMVLGNWSHSCKDTLSISWWCVSAGSVYTAYARIICYFAVSLFLVFAFCYDINKPKAGFKAIFSIEKKKLRFMGFSACVCAIFFAALGIDFWLIFRKANPDWLVEFGFFLIVFFLATLAVLILRTSASFGLFLQKDKIPDFKKLFELTHGKFYVVLITFCVLTYAVNLLQMRAMGLLESWNILKNYFYVAIISEFLSSALKFAVLSVYVAYFLSMSQCLMPEDIAEKPEESAKKQEKPEKAKKTTKKRETKKKTNKRR